MPDSYEDDFEALPFWDEAQIMRDVDEHRRCAGGSSEAGGVLRFLFYLFQVVQQ